MYIDLKIWWRICKMAHGEKLAGRKKVRRLAIFWLGSLFVLFSNFFLLLDNIIFPGFRRVVVSKPVFVIGNMRSGTTRMHHLLSEDEDHTVNMALWEIILPSLCLRKLVYGVARLDAALFRNAIATRISNYQERKFAKARRMHQWNLSQPEEDEFAFYHCMRSAALLVLFPYYGHFDDLSWTDQEPEAVRRRMMKFYRRLIQRNLYLHGTDKRYVAKSPSFVAKIQTLHEAFPDARFIYMARNPHEMMASGINLLYKTWQALGSSQSDLEKRVSLLAEQQLELYEYATEQLEKLPDAQLAWVEYRELSAQPKALLERLYHHFDWSLDDVYRAYLDREQDKAEAGYRSQHRYTSSELGPSAAEIERRLAGLFARYEWPSAVAGAAEPTERQTNTGSMT